MSDILGPANAENAVTTRPPETRTFASLDTWFEDCSSQTADDGTELQAAFFNGLLGQLRTFWRGNGRLGDNITPVVAELGNADGSLLLAAQYLIQRGQTNVAIAVGTANALTATLSPAPAELTFGLVARVKITYANTTATPTLRLNATAATTITDQNGAALAVGALRAGNVVTLVFDGTVFRALDGLDPGPTLRSQLGSTFIRDQRDPTDIVQNDTAGSLYQVSPTGTLFGQFTLPAGYINIYLSACFYVDGLTTASTGIYVGIFYREHGTTNWTFLESQRDTMPAGKVISLMRNAAVTLDPAKSHDFIAHLMKDTATGVPTAVSGNLLGLALKV